MDYKEKMMPKKSLWKLLAVVVLVLALLAWQVFIPFFQMEDANWLMATGEYENAAQAYSELSGSLAFGAQAREKHALAKRKAAEKAVEKKDFERAEDLYLSLNDGKMVTEVQMAAAAYYLETGLYEKAAKKYERAGDAENAGKAWTRYGDSLVDGKEYEKAVDAYTKGGNGENEEKIRAAQIAWADDCLANNRLDEAAEHYLQAGMEQKAREIVMKKAEQMISSKEVDGIIDVLKPYKGKDIVDLLFRAMALEVTDTGSSNAAASARTYGESILNTEMQLYYCRLLLDKGFDLKQVYPDGVEVDMDLAKYQFYNDWEQDSIPDASKVIIFTRTEGIPELKTLHFGASAELEKEMKEETEKRKGRDYGYTIKLRTDIMMDLNSDQQAWNLDECTAYIVLEEGYYPSGYISIRTGRESALTGLKDYSSILGTGYTSLLNSSSTTYQMLNHYASFGMVSVYDKRDMTKGTIINHYIHHPIASNAVIGNNYEDAGIDLNSLDIEEIQNALKDKESEESKEILAKYDEKDVEFVEKNGWGDYVVFPDKDENGNQRNVRGTSDNVRTWFVPKYFIANPEENWITSQINGDLLSYLKILRVLSESGK